MFLEIFKRIKLRKITTVLTAASFIFSIFSADGWAAPFQMPMPAMVAPVTMSADYIIPFNLGRVTDSVNFKTDKVIVQIQDLHSHEETQRNIASILSFLDSHYKINKVYVEGAVSDVDTSWLANISDENLKNSIINSLLSKGILTGSELFSINSGKTKILKGIEDRKTYLENFNRLVTIDSQREEIKSLFLEIRMILSYLADQHYGKENKKIDSVVRKYKDGKISFDRYFAYIVKKAKKQNIYFGFYPSIVLLSNIINVQSKLNKDKINSQISNFYNELKSEISYGEYKELIDYSSKPETEGIFYFKLAEIYNKGNYSGKYPELAKFLQFISLNQTINPLNLVNEERALLWEVRNNAAKTNMERELIYLSSFIDLMEGFLENKISAPEYKYFEKELPNFKSLWTKHTRMSELPGLEQYYPLFESFYKVNVERNNIFIKEISGKLPKTREVNMMFSKDMIMTGVSELLASAKEIEVIVSGGFHTQDISRILQNARQSYLVITPNVTQDAALADKLFAQDVARISKFIPSNTFQKPISSGAFDLVSETGLKAVVGAYFNKALLDAVKSYVDSANANKEKKAISISEVINADESFGALKRSLADKGLEDFNIKITPNEDGTYTVEASAQEIPSGTFTVAENGILPEYNVTEAYIYGIAGIITGAIVAATSVFGIVASVSIVAPVIAVLGLSVSILTGLGIFGFSAVSISNAKRVKDALEKTAQEELTDVKKERVAVYVNMLNIRYAGKLNGATLQNDEGGLKVIADADEANKIIRVNALALMELDQDLVDNIILNHELMHIKGIKSELRAHLNDIFSFKGVKSYLFGKKSLASPLLNFYSALDDYNAYKNFEDGYEKAEKIYFLIKSINILRSSIGADVIKIFPPEYAKQVLEELESNVASELLKDYKTLGGDSKQVVNKNLEKYKEILEVYKVKEAADRKKDETEDLALAEKALKEKEFKEENEALPETELKEKENIQSSIILLEEIVNVYEVSKTEADFEKAEKALEAIKFDVINEVETSLIAFKKAIEAYGKNKTKETFEMLEVAVSMAVTRVENSLKAKEFDVQEDVVKTLLSSLEQYKKAIENYSGNKTVGTSMALAAAEKAALDARSLYIEERMKILRPQVGQVCKIIEKLYGISPEEEIQQLVMTLEYMRSIKEGHSTDVENFLLDENLDGEIVMRNYKGLVVRWSDIKKEKYESNLKEISVAFSLGLAGIGESLDRVRFLKAWYVLQVRQGEAKTDAEREAISKAVENGEFLNPEWYTDDYAKLIRDKKMQEKYGLDITTEDNPKFKTEAGDPQLKTKALDIGLRVRERKNGYWTIKSVAEIILDDFIAKKNAGFAGLTLNLLTNNESLEDVKKLLKKVSSTGKTYEEELINLDVLKKVQDKEDGVYLQKTHPTIQYDEKTGKVNFFRFQQLINHGSFFANLVRQMVENKEKSADNKDIFWFFGNTDNFLAGQVPLNLFGWMDATKTPAVIIVTEKGTNEGNKKGGIPMIVGNAVSALGTSVPIFKIIEIAQVKGDKVLEKKFQESTKAFFNTNMLVVSKHEIISLIEELKMALNDPNVVATISKEYPMKNLDSKEKIMERLYVLGDLIINNKENYVKLEIAISSSLMELNNLIALATGKTLLKFVFLNDEEAQEMFGPIKNKDNFDETFENSTMDMNNPNPHEKGIHPLSALKTQDESSQSGVQKFIKDIINRLIEPLRREWKRAYITKYYPELAGLEDILVYGEGVYEKGSAIEKIALEKADLGKNVNVVIPVGSNDITNATVKNTGNMYIYEKTFVQKNGFAVRVYFYENKSAAYNAYKYVVDNLDGLVGIVENASDISFNDIIVASPLAAIFAITKNAEEDAKAKRDGYSNVTNGISEIDKIEILGDTQKINRDGDDMRNQLPLITNIDLSKINDANIEALISTVFSVELTLQEFYDKAQALKDFIKKTHSKNKRVVLNFKPVNKAEAEDIIEMIGKKGLKILRTAGIGIDGIIFDFNSLQQEEFNEIKVRLEKIPSIIKRENSTAIISVKSAYYTEQQRISGIDNFDEYINISGNYNDNTVDANEIAESARKAIKGGAKALFIDYEILKLFVTKGINIDIYSLFLGIVAVWTSYVKKTPEGIYKNARRSGFRENISAITLEQETKLYDVLKKLDAGDESVIKGVGTILQTSKANTLETKEEAQGYVQGVLERILVSRFGEKTFEYRTNADVYRIALVKAKMNNISDNDIKKYLDDKGGENSRNALEKYGMSTENLNFSQAQEAAQEGINAIISDLENDTVRPEDLPQALADLLVMLSVVKTIEVEVSHVEVSSQRDGVRAMLSAA